MADRGLTPGEIQLARSVFGDAIDYSKVRVTKEYWNPLGLGLFEAFAKNRAHAPDGKVHVPDPIIRWEPNPNSHGSYRSHRWGVRSIMKACCGLLIAFSVYGCVGDLAGKQSVPATLTREERLKIAADAFFKFQCEKQWDLLWPLAREGDGEALSDLANELGYPGGGLELPDSDVDTSPRDKRSANALAMAIYGAAAPRYPSKRNLHLFLGADRDIDVVVVSLRSGTVGYRRIKAFPQSSLKRLERCLAEASSPAVGDRCVSLAIEWDLHLAFPNIERPWTTSWLRTARKAAFAVTTDPNF